MSESNPEIGEPIKKPTSREIAIWCRELLVQTAYHPTLQLTDADVERIAASSEEDAAIDAYTALLAAEVVDPENVMRERGIEL